MSKLSDDKEKVLVVAVKFQEESVEDFEYSLEELERLIFTARGEVVYLITQRLTNPNPATFIGKGKIDEVKEYLIVNPDVETVVFDNELNPRQARNLTNYLGVKVLDRTEVILDIFAARAQTKEAQLEIELAQLEYLMPRLTHLWSHLERQEGGLGTRGPGETQLETDRRLIRNRAAVLRRKIKDVEKHRGLQRAGRKKNQQKVVSLVGYTNAGKSTLLQSLSKKEIYVADKLFATLDPVIRKVYLPGLQQEVLFSDTVGFINKLPHGLVKSFKSTLEEVVHADLILHIVDIAAPDYERQIEAVYDVLEELAAKDKKIITVFNKVDLRPDFDFAEIDEIYQPAIAISAKEKQGIDALISAIEITL